MHDPQGCINGSWTEPKSSDASFSPDILANPGRSEKQGPIQLVLRRYKVVSPRSDGRCRRCLVSLGIQVESSTLRRSPMFSLVDFTRLRDARTSLLLLRLPRFCNGATRGYYPVVRTLRKRDTSWCGIGGWGGIGSSTPQDSSQTVLL